MTIPSQPPPLDRNTVRELVRMALEEDGAGHDLTTDALVPLDQEGRGTVVAKSAGIICGLPFAAGAYALLDPRLRWLPATTDGSRVAAGDAVAEVAVAEVTGPLHAILRGERVALNFLQRLSGIATMTGAAVEAVAHTGAKILDTRKTTPGLRPAERYAVQVGGGFNHRFNLGAGILIKDNHIAAVRARGGSLADAVRAAQASAAPATAVEVEVTSLAELDEALDAGARAILLDNFAPETLAAAVRRARSRGALTEASGGITLENIAAVADSGVDYISLGAITHSVPALDLSLQLLVD